MFEMTGAVLSGWTSRVSVAVRTRLPLVAVTVIVWAPAEAALVTFALRTKLSDPLAGKVTVVFDRVKVASDASGTIVAAKVTVPVKPPLLWTVPVYPAADPPAVTWALAGPIVRSKSFMARVTVFVWTIEPAVAVMVKVYDPFGVADVVLTVSSTSLRVWDGPRVTEVGEKEAVVLAGRPLMVNPIAPWVAESNEELAEAAMVYVPVSPAAMFGAGAFGEALRVKSGGVVKVNWAVALSVFDPFTPVNVRS